MTPFEPANPIVVYIHPLTPKMWVPYLIQGIDDWHAAAAPSTDALTRDHPVDLGERLDRALNPKS